MASVVITAIGDDRSGLVESLSGAIAEHGGNWDRSHMAELAGKFAGIVLVTVPDANLNALTAALQSVDAEGKLTLTIEHARSETETETTTSLAVTLVGQDHPGIVHDISRALASRRVSIDELETEVVPAPMGGHLFRAIATIEAPAGESLDELQEALEAVASDLMVDIDVTGAPD